MPSGISGWVMMGALLLGLPSPAHGGEAARLVLQVEGRGVQIYGCQSKAGAAPAWVLVAPDADLLDPSGAVVGHHGAGPVWQYKDGSSVRGEVMRRQDAPEAGAVPWLVLRAKDAAGNGLLRQVTEIRRDQTHGGVAPAAGCDAQHVGAEVRVPYSATYRFFSGEAVGEGGR